ncbi:MULTISPECIES: hypothetical protein [Galbibacter]|uniref:Secreted protein n=1 Tax=Galbibacter pacificus TaxID=2996052 RepID=A0ABT6FRX2_9FLAO|nr:hypothetical protein [Galbibacter pacificus]MDG3582871.1 hypothetical protein [Galbibacter pacificus]MDG3586010.1 hypothetical protein [Galbibacter pacificus]
MNKLNFIAVLTVLLSLTFIVSCEPEEIDYYPVEIQSKPVDSIPEKTIDSLVNNVVDSTRADDTGDQGNPIDDDRETED